MKLLFGLFFTIFYSYSYSQSPITPKDAFYSGLKVNNLNAGDKVVYIRLTGVSPKTFQWGEIYASYFDKDNYIKAANDEFQRVPYLTQKYKELNEGIKNADLNKTFSFVTTIPVGIYNSECGCFPLEKKSFLENSPWLLNVKSVGTKELTFNNSFVRYSISNYVNFNDFDFTFKINPTEAAKFIDSRKDKYGKIDRKITIKVVYNIVDQSVQNGDRDYYVNVYIHKLEFYNGSSLLGSTFPKFDYYDKVKLIKTKPKVFTINDVSGTYNGISETAGSTITINSDATVLIQGQGSTFNGKATLTSTREKLEKFKNIIKSNLDKDIQETGYIIEIDFNYNGDNKHSSFYLFKDEEYLILSQDRGSFLKKIIR